jgi:cell division protein FtsI (penicillin-binding protein 3)
MKRSARLPNERGAVTSALPALSEPVFAWRLLMVGIVLGAAMLTLAWRLIDLQVIKHEFLNGEGDLRTVRTQSIYATRGNIFDRNGEPLAISAPVYTIHANPRLLDLQAGDQEQLAEALGLPLHEVAALLGGDNKRGFVYLARQASPEIAEKVAALKLTGVAQERDSKRFYPAGEVVSHLVGFASIDGHGQEGVELAYDQWLSGSPGVRKVLIDARRKTIKHLSLEKNAEPGKDLHLSVDLRLQFHAYRELKAAVQAHAAQSGTLVMLDVATGEVLAMVNQPGFNSNDRASLKPENIRNRAITDVFEPGSTVKPFTIAAALNSQKFSAGSEVNTSPGFIRLNGRTIRDLRDYGVIDVNTVLSKSSNVGTSRIALKTGGEAVRGQFFSAGLGQATGIEFPGESVGTLPNYSKWKPVNLATMSYGYGLSVTALQLAQAYSAIAAGGEKHTSTLVKGGNAGYPVETIMPAWVARQITGMLEQAVSKGGTGSRAQTVDYRVAGKTGTAHKTGVSGYEDDKYLAVFAGFAPLSKPRLAMVVVISAPQKGEYYGGEVAAPVFSRVIGHALRVLNVVPDQRVIQSVAHETRKDASNG